MSETGKMKRWEKTVLLAAAYADYNKDGDKMESIEMFRAIARNIAK